MESVESARPAESGAVASEISREIVRLHARLYGRGPTKAKTHLNHDFALCVLEDVFMPAEKTLIGAGNSAQVRATRDAFQLAVEKDFVAIVERFTGRKVRAFFSQVHIPSETAVELFVFAHDGEPRQDGDPPTDGDGRRDGSPRADGDGPPAD